MPIIKKNSINLVHISSSIEGTFKQKQVFNIIDDFKKNYDKNKIFCIMAHDYTFKSNENLFFLYNELMKLNNNYPIKFTNLDKL